MGVDGNAEPRAELAEVRVRHYICEDTTPLVHLHNRNDLFITIIAPVWIEAHCMGHPFLGWWWQHCIVEHSSKQLSIRGEMTLLPV